ncbi:TRAP transporter small permease [Profundibacter sp.]
MKTVFRNLLHFEGMLAVTAYAVTTLLLLVDVISREVWSHSIFGAQKIAVFSAIIAAALGLAIATGNNAHFRAGFADGLLPFRWADRLGDLVSAALFAGLAWYALQFVIESYRFNDKAEVLYFPLWPLQAVFPYAFASASFKHIVYLFDPELKKLAEPGD